MLAKAPFKVHRLLTDNDQAFTDRLASRRSTLRRASAPVGTPPADQRHGRAFLNRLHGSFNGRISEVLATHRFESSLGAGAAPCSATATCTITPFRKKRSGISIGINDGSVARQRVLHLHVHFISRHQDDVADPQAGRSAHPAGRESLLSF